MRGGEFDNNPIKQIELERPYWTTKAQICFAVDDV